MAVVVNTNVASMITQRNLTNATSSLGKTMQRLSTGFKLNQASDDAAGLFIAKGLEAQVRGSQMCQQNIAVGINVLQTGEGDLSVIQDNLMRIKDLVTQASSSFYSTDGRNAIKDEVSQRIEEIERIAKCSSFNGLKLLDGTDPELTTKGLRLQVGPGSVASTNAIILRDVFTDSRVEALGLINGTYSSGGVVMNSTFTTLTSAFSSASTAAMFIRDCDESLKVLSRKRASIGVCQNRLQMTNDSLAISIENLTASKSTIVDADIALETANFTRSQILQQASASLLLQANQAATIALKLIG